MRTITKSTWDRMRARAFGSCLLAERAGAEDGFLLIEVIVSSLLVALIVIGTFNGFDVANRISTSERQHDEASVLAAESQEQLRSDPASVLAALQLNPHSYTQTVQGTVYTIDQTAELQPSGGSAGTCNAGNSSRQSGNSYRITSNVSWHGQEQSKRPAVRATSLITPPIGSSLEVDVLTAPASTAGVSGVPVTITYTPEGSTGTATQTQTTGSEGCVIFGAVPSSEAEVSFGELAGYVTPSGEPKLSPKKETIAPNYTTHAAVRYYKGATVQANYVYKGAASANHKNNEETAEVAQTVTGDTFVAANTAMEVEPNYELGSTSYGTATTPPYAVKTGTFAASALSKANLFPFIESEDEYWAVYAGDCTANNPETVTNKAVMPQEKLVLTPGGTTQVAVPTSYTTLNLYSKRESEVAKLSHAYTALETSNSYAVLIDNLGCKGLTPDNETEASYQHSQVTSTGSSLGGHLSDPFQPFGKEFTLCLVSTKTDPPQTYKVKYANTAVNGGAFSIYLPQRPLSEVVAEKAAKKTEYEKDESEYKAKEPYKGDAGYSGKAAEAATEKAKYTEWLNEYKADHERWEKDKAEYTSLKSKYEAEKTVYTNDKSKYETEKTNYNNKKTEPYKANYEKYEKEYKTAETKYKTYKAEYEAAETKYKTYEAEYKTYEAKYKTDETEYKTDETEYKKYEAAYKAEEKAATEYTYYTEYVSDKLAYEAAKAAYTKAGEEEKEGTGVTVEKGTTCT